MSTTATANLGAPLSQRWRRGWIGEIVGMTIIYQLYNLARDRATGSTATAFANAKDIVAAERALGIYWERAVQQAFLNVDWFMAFFNIYYGTIHFFLPLITLVLLYRKFPVRYVRWRNTLIAMWVIAIATFVVYPLMPPRLMPARYGFVDTAAEYFNFGPQVKVRYAADGQPAQSALAQYGNPFAAMPSFHVGWSTWCVLALWPIVRQRWLRALLVFYALSVIFAITVTANHWLLDAVGGWIVLGLGFITALGVERARKLLRKSHHQNDSKVDSSQRS